MPHPSDSQRLPDRQTVYSWTPLSYRQAGVAKDAYRRYTRNFLLALVCVMGCLMAVNYVIDPYNVFGTAFLPIDLEGNQRFEKIAFLNDRRAAYDTFIMGSSRAGVLQPSSVERLLPGARAYNLSLGAGTPAEHLRHLQYLLDAGFPVRMVLLEVDADFLADRPGQVDYGLAPHPATEGRSLASAYWTYLTIFPTQVWKKKIAENWLRHRQPVSLHLSTGVMEFVEAEEAIATRGDEYFQGALFADRPLNRDPYRSMANQFVALQAIQQICRARAIDCRVFVTPHHRLVMDTLNAEGYLESLQRLGDITEYEDFSGYHRVSLDNRNYYEPSHYRPFIGDRILRHMLTPKPAGTTSGQLTVDDAWGVHLTKENLATHIGQARAALFQQDAVRR